MSQHRVRALSARALLVALLALAGFVVPTVPAYALPTAAEGGVLGAELRADLEEYLQVRGEAEHVSAAVLSVRLPDRNVDVDVAAGTTTLGGPEPVPADSVWQLGSHGKAFTAVLLLQLEAESRLSLDDPLGRWLPEYPQWADVPLRRLLNMTSGIPSYDRQPAFQGDYVADPLTYFSAERLIGYALGAEPTTGYSYSNTNYVLAELVVERVSGRDYADELQDRLLDPLCLEDTYYEEHLYPASVTDRLPAGYFAIDQIPGLSGLSGRDVSRDTLSWGRAAGGIVGTMADLARWTRALYAGELLPPEQQAQLTSLVSVQTGEPIAQTSPADPGGYGLGVVQITAEELGTFWTYTGGTWGFRTLHVYLPESGLIIAIGLNSRPAEDQMTALVVAVYETLIEQGVVAAPAPARGAA